MQTILPKNTLPVTIKLYARPTEVENFQKNAMDFKSIVFIVE